MPNKSSTTGGGLQDVEMDQEPASNSAAADSDALKPQEPVDAALELLKEKMNPPDEATTGSTDHSSRYMTQEGSSKGATPSIADLFKKSSQSKTSSAKESDHIPEKEPNPKVCKALSFDS